MVVAPGSSDPFGIFVVWHNGVEIGELVVTDCTYSVLFGDSPFQPD
jgi:hypothetical protein